MAESKRTCSIPDCDRSGKLSRGMCGMHYQRFRTTGSAGEGSPRRRAASGACDIPFCAKPMRRKGLCELHYRRLLRTGTTDAPKRETVAQRFWKKVDTSGDCWVWTKSTDSSGYGTFNTGGSTASAHRFAWALANGPIPADLELDHECHNTRCVRLGHLRISTRKQNVEYKNGPFRNSKSGVRGVHMDRRMKKWRAEVQHYGQSIVVGYFEDLAEADAAVRAKRAELFTFPEVV